MMRLILLLIALFNVAINKAVKLCPVSSNSQFSSNGDHIYPMELYYKKLSTSKSISLEACQIKEDTTGRMSNYTCPLNLPACPFIDENIADGLQSSLAWQKSTTMCSLKEKMTQSNKTINVFVFGGSATIGTNTHGCCRYPECFVSTNNFTRCAWSHYFERWMRTQSVSVVNVFNLARSGATSDYSAESLDELMEKVEPKGFTENDIIFIDHSVNDNRFCLRATFDTLQRGLEKLIRRLLTMKSNNSTGIPTIILIESDTYLKKFENYKACFTKMYKEIAQHYGLRIYSVIDAVYSNNSIVKQAAFHSSLINHVNSWKHPPWDTHLWYADFISSLLLHEMDHCATLYKSDGVSTYVLPHPLTSINDSAKCDPLVKPFLKISYDNIMSNTTIGNFSIPVKDTWQVRLDRKGRGGIITELTNQSSFAIEHLAAINFNLTLTYNELNTWTKKGDVVLQLIYLKSYENSGIVKMVYCGHETQIDSLWKEYKNFRYSTPAIMTVPLYNCVKEGANQSAMISFQHLVGDFGDMEKFIQHQPRTSQLFKIISIVVCKY